MVNNLNVKMVYSCDIFPFSCLSDADFYDVISVNTANAALDINLHNVNNNPLNLDSDLNVNQVNQRIENRFTPLLSYIQNNFANFKPNIENYSRNLNLQDFNVILRSRQNSLMQGISVIHLNIRSLNANLEEFQALIKSFDNPIDIIVLTEIWTTNISFYSNVLPDYNLITDLPLSTKVGGVGIFTRRNLKVSHRLDLRLEFETPHLCENVWLEISKNQSTFLVAGLYRHPNNNIVLYSNKLQQNLNKIALMHPSRPCIIATDCNINLLRFENNASIRDYVDALAMHNFFPMILSPTRITDSTATLIDHIYFFNNDDKIYKSHSGNIEYQIADHMTNYILLYGTKDKAKHDYKNRPFIRVYSEARQVEFQNKLSVVDWNMFFNDCIDVNECYNKFESSLKCLHDETFPLRRMSRKQVRDKNWVTPNIREACKQKSKLYNKYINTRSPADKEAYTKHKNEVVKMCQTAKRNYYKSELNEASDSKHYWKIINTLLTNKEQTHRQVEKVIVNTETITNPNRICEEFNKFFSSIGSALSSAIPPGVAFETFLGASVQNSIFVEPITQTEIFSLVSGLDANKASNDSFLNAKLLKRHINTLNLPLTHIFNLSIETGVVPTCLKIAKVVPIYKKGDHSHITNYRPISLIPTVIKILEKLIYNRVYNYLDKHEILYKYQFGFRPNHSTSLAVLEVVDYCYQNLSAHNDVLGIYIDISKAFDTVDHVILLKKLYHYGIRGSLYEWFKSYLSGRTQFCSIGSEASSLVDVNMGVPQGSILGPLLFLVYMNDLANVSNNLKLFADDTNIFECGKTQLELETQGNLILTKISDWMISNKLTINLDKSCYTIFYGNKNRTYDITIKINDHVLKRTRCTKYLGILIDENLNWSEHIDSLYYKLLKYVGIFYKIKHFLTTADLVKIYYGLIYPHILYGIEIYANTYSSYLQKLNVLNNKLLRVIQNANMKTPLAQLYKNVNVLPIQKLHVFNIMLITHKVIYNKSSLPNVFHNYFTPTRQIHSYNSRTNNCNLYIISVSNERGKRNLKFKAPHLWNHLSYDIKCISSFFIFKKSLKLYLMNNNN